MQVNDIDGGSGQTTKTWATYYIYVGVEGVLGAIVE